MTSLFSELRRLLGASKDAPETRRILDTFAPGTEIVAHETGYECVLYTKGVELAFDDDGLLDTVFFYPTPQDGGVSVPFRGKTVDELSFPFSVAELTKRLGRPHKQRPRQMLLGVGVPPTSIFRLEDCMLHVEHGADNDPIIRLILVRKME